MSIQAGYTYYIDAASSILDYNDPLLLHIHPLPSRRLDRRLQRERGNIRQSASAHNQAERIAKRLRLVSHNQAEAVKTRLKLRQSASANLE